MARSHTIWVVHNPNGDEDFAIFTVKHEALTYVRGLDDDDMELLRLSVDGPTKAALLCKGTAIEWREGA